MINVFIQNNCKMSTPQHLGSCLFSISEIIEVRRFSFCRWTSCMKWSGILPFHTWASYGVSTKQIAVKRLYSIPMMPCDKFGLDTYCWNDAVKLIFFQLLKFFVGKFYKIRINYKTSFSVMLTEFSLKTLLCWSVYFWASLHMSGHIFF